MKRMLMMVLAMMLAMVMLVGSASAEYWQTMPMDDLQIYCGIERAKLWAEPRWGADTVDWVECGDVLYPIAPMVPYGEFMKVQDEKGNQGYIYLKYLAKGFIIQLGDQYQNIYRSEIYAINRYLGMNAVSAHRKNEQLLIIGQTPSGMLNVITLEKPISSGYVPAWDLGIPVGTPWGIDCPVGNWQ